MCIISGCDYVNSLQGLGLKTAYKLVKMAPSLQHVLKQLRRKGHALDGDYEAQVIRAEQTFLHQVVWDPVHQTQRHLTDPPAALADKLAFAGTLHRDPAVARALAIGDAHPVTEVSCQEPLPLHGTVPASSFKPQSHPQPSLASHSLFHFPSPLSFCRKCSRMVSRLPCRQVQVWPA
eukprot:m.225674 g.225674  ORF g.225674 m.225674 type:complete len:177 (-) comp15161_c0_seq19:1581-2111(-)